ncbi:dihydroorotase [Idiomarina xiamenensis]|uniref:Dihydroorotase n=1 Tax=Idiomarina xiamenensis 10-D-4 TaxID=740709 RepID=K2L6J7_9GAMM|nr:dihydroorotase [Idiomarina xiamenensis]EKE85415.1 dihydroorotase [Idiomarina xiamenensis 10-D-4]
MSSEFSIPTPDDWHLHLRDGELLNTTVAATAAVFERAVIMPNLVPPVVTVEQALAYRERILAVLPKSMSFTPLMMLFLSPQTTVDEVKAVADNPHMLGFKMYPSGATTNSDSGVSRVEAMYPLFEAMQEHDVPLLVHGEVTDGEIDIFDREAVFIERHLRPISEAFPRLRLVLEHITTAQAADFVEQAHARVAATITPQHLLMNRNDLLVGGIRPHNYCLPILKRREHQLRLQQAALSGNPKFFLGTDSAPHARDKKEAPCGCAGCYSAPAALPLYAEFFASHDALDKLADFASHFGADFYGIARNSSHITLQKNAWQVPASITTAVGPITPYWANEALSWQVQGGKQG